MRNFVPINYNQFGQCYMYLCLISSTFESKNLCNLGDIMKENILFGTQCYIWTILVVQLNFVSHRFGIGLNILNYMAVNI